MGGYAERDLARWVDEHGKAAERTAFARDRARVLHSAGLRRLAATTQVVVPHESDFPRTRLTHSLECAQVGRELGEFLGCDPDLVETACLAHDLGHPPFGHNGETALDEVAAGCGGFEGNAQSLRILTRLEAKAFAADGRSVGLNLTRATLDAATKYPWPREDPRSAGGRKYGVYEDDLDVLAWARAGAPDARRCLEAQVMDWADDVAYSVHDLEDALHSGHLSPARLRDPDESSALLEETRTRYAPQASAAALEQALERLLSLSYWPSAYDRSHRALAALKNATSQLIGRFCGAAQMATRAEFGDGPLARYDADLVVPEGTVLECAVLKGVTARYVMAREGVAELQRRQRTLVAELAEALLAQAPGCLDPVFAPAFADAADDAARLRVVVDQVASLTDPSAEVWHARLTGGDGDTAR
ncbi:MAG: deoxyguanosinetriphosphate triphosphohydrolase [Actinomycetes bacterium]